MEKSKSWTVIRISKGQWHVLIVLMVLYTFWFMYFWPFVLLDEFVLFDLLYSMYSLTFWDPICTLCTLWPLVPVHYNLCTQKVFVLFSLLPLFSILLYSLIHIQILVKEFWLCFGLICFIQFSGSKDHILGSPRGVWGKLPLALSWKQKH
jgi:hypothetical protein